MGRRASRLQLVLTGIIALVVLILAGPVSVLLVIGTEGGLAAVTATIVVSVLLSAAAGLSIGWPGLALAVAWVSAIAQMIATLPPLPANIAILMVLYATGAAGSRAIRIAGLASAAVGALAAAAYLTVPSLSTTSSSTVLAIGSLLVVAVLVTLVLAWTFGVLVAAIRRGRAERASAAAAQLETIAEQERGRIARDMHDVVAHSLGVIVAQADGARYLATSDPARTGDALQTIAGIARDALGDVRLLLSRLRHQQGDLPQPSLADLEALLTQFREAGLRVEAEIGPAPERATAGVQLAVYRILQESLTNALRHGDPATPVRVAVAWGAHEVTIEVASRRPDGSAIGEAGHGITGMRERARLVGGSLSAAPRDDSFLVTARLPLSASPEGSSHA